MLATLNRLHAELTESLSGLAQLTEGPRPDPTTLAERRLAVVRASLARSRFLEQEAYPHLLATLPAAAAEPVRRLKDEAVALRLSSSRHVSTWTLGEALRDWPGYRAASHAMRSEMHRRIAEEKALLGPLLAPCGQADKAA